MRDFINAVSLNESEAPSEPKFYVRSIENPRGVPVWQYGMMTPSRGDKIFWNSGTFKNMNGAIKSATSRYMNPNGTHQFMSSFFKNPIVLDLVPITDRSNPFCVD